MVAELVDFPDGVTVTMLVSSELQGCLERSWSRPVRHLLLPS